MLFVRNAISYIKRTVRPLYGFTQATPQSCYLDADWDRSVDIYPGMVMQRTSGENVTLLGGVGGSTTVGVPYGLSAHYVGGDGIDEVARTGLNVFAVWVLAPDAQFEVLAPAFNTAVTWTDPGDGTEVLLYGQRSGAAQGKLTNVSTNNGDPVARLVKVNSASKITIAGLR